MAGSSLAWKDTGRRSTAQWRAGPGSGQQVLDALVNPLSDDRVGPFAKVNEVDEMLAEIGQVFGIEHREHVDDANAQQGADLAGDRVALGDVFESLPLPFDPVRLVTEETEAGLVVARHDIG